LKALEKKKGKKKKRRKNLKKLLAQKKKQRPLKINKAKEEFFERDLFHYLKKNMATAQLPQFGYTPYSRIEQQLFPELENEVSKWLKLENFDVEIPSATPVNVSYNWVHPQMTSYSVPITNAYAQSYGIPNNVTQAFPFLPPGSSSQYSMSTTSAAMPVFGSTPVTPLVTYPQQISQQMSVQNQMQQMSPQFYSLLSQLVKNPSNQLKEDGTEDKKRKRDRDRSFVRRVRQTRPKVVEAKGAIQCKGTNRKRGAQCRNAALMEYIGPRPIYCAEHIELDPESLYEKCKSPYQKEPGDNKGCKEVVLKEFGICYKHYIDVVNVMHRECDLTRAHNDLKRISELLTQLEKEAAAAKKKDGDLYQRKNKLIPKFLEMRKLATKTVEEITSRMSKDAISYSEESQDYKEKVEITLPMSEGIVSSVLQLPKNALPLMDIDLRSIELRHLTDGTLSFDATY